MRRVLASALLSLLLLLSQQAGLLHALVHLERPADAAHVASAWHGDHGDPVAYADTADAEDAHDAQGHAAGKPCKDCLAFAHLDSVVHAAVAPPALLCGMRFHGGVFPVLAAQDAECPAARSRGPPVAG